MTSLISIIPCALRTAKGRLDPERFYGKDPAQTQGQHGNYIWQPSVTVGTPDTILNRPCYSSSFAPELAAGKRPLIFGDFSYYWIADREYRSFKRLNELYAANGQIGFLASQRVDGLLMLKESVKALEVKAKG